MQRRQLLLAVGTLAAIALPARAAEADVAAILAETGAPGLAGMVVDAKGVKRLVFGGVRRQGAADPVTADDPWHLGSNGKAMTAAVYGRLVDQGKAAWGADLKSLFPDIAIDPAFAGLTIEHLLGHRSGIQDGPLMRGGFLMRAHQDQRPLAIQRAELARTILTAPPTGPVGAFAYSNVGYALAGAAIERITGQSFEDALTAQLYRPLSMSRAGFGAPVGPAPWGHAGPAGALRPVDPAGLSDNPPAISPAGRMHMSLADYAAFLRTLLSDGQGWLKPDTVRRLTTPVAGEGQSYALGWGVSTQAWSPGPILAHEGSNTLWHALTILAPASGLAFVGVTNASPDASRGAARKLVQALRLAEGA